VHIKVRIPLFVNEFSLLHGAARTEDIPYKDFKTLKTEGEGVVIRRQQ